MIFNAFVFWQIFNELNARSLFDDVNVLSGILTNHTFIAVLVGTIGLQVLMVQAGSNFTRTTALTGHQWLATVLLGAIALPVGVAMRFIPVKESKNDFYYSERAVSESESGSELSTISAKPRTDLRADAL
jgi:Ca2+-transporting ATPase